MFIKLVGIEMKEIGSEFYKNPFIKDKNEEKKIVFDNKERGFLCGRTALEYIIRDAKKSYGIKYALLPSYCCHTMIEPFIRNAVSVRFYSVIIENEQIRCILPERKDNEVLYITPYFGMSNTS